MKHLIKKLLREALTDDQEVITPKKDYIDIPPINSGDDYDGDNGDGGYYYLEWVNYWKGNINKISPVLGVEPVYQTNSEFPPRFSEVWNDEAYRKKLNSYKDTQSFKFYSKLWYEHMYNHSQLKNQIQEEIINYIDSYNKSVNQLDKERKRDKEFEEIMNTHQIELGGKNVVYNLETPSKGYVNRFIKQGESEEEANQKLFNLVKIRDLNEPDSKNTEEWDKWVKTVYKPFFEKFIDPFIEKNNWRLWSY